MYYIANTDRLLQEGVLDQGQVAILRAQARETMTVFGVNAVLTLGILAATGGLISWLGDPVPVALSGAALLLAGFVALWRGGETLRFFGHAAALIGAGLLLAGAAAEVLDNYSDVAGPALMGLGALVAAIFGWGFRSLGASTRFVCGAIFLMAGAQHLLGLVVSAGEWDWTGWAVALASLYGAAVLVAAGVVTNIRVVTALAILPFAQMLAAGADYWHAIYVIRSPEPTLTILQMAALIAAALWAARALPARVGRHGTVLAAMAGLVVNAAALVGSVAGDVVGDHLWGPGSPRWWLRGPFEDHEAWLAAREAFEATAVQVSAPVYAVLWAVVLVALLLLAARGRHRGLFNTVLIFGWLHGYTQMFQAFSDEPLAYVIGGLAAIPLAWGMWQLDRRWLRGTSSPA